MSQSGRVAELRAVIGSLLEHDSGGHSGGDPETCSACRAKRNAYSTLAKSERPVYVLTPLRARLLRQINEGGSAHLVSKALRAAEDGDFTALSALCGDTPEDAEI